MAPGMRAGEVVENLLKRECAGVRDALRQASRTGPWIAAGPLDPGIHLAASDPFFRVGNAAGEAHPIIGEGLSMALQSAFLLCAHLLADAPPRDADRLHEVSRMYATAWRRAFAPRLLLAAAFAHAAMRPRSAAALLALMRSWPALLTHGARWGGKVRSAS
jgi:flavin-dependent dehydrogenase